MDKPHILIVDDDNRILKLLKQFLNKEGFLVSISTSTNDAIKLIKTFNFDLIILDVMMPEITGIEFAKKLKNEGSSMPIVMLTALSEPEDKIKGLEAGANDYLTKPFEPRELLLRINNLINSYSNYKKEQKIVRFGNNQYNIDSKEFIQGDKVVYLSSSEEKLLDLFVQKNNQVISRNILSSELGGLNLRSIDVQIVRLRNKIESDPKNPQYLKTIRHEGYVFYI